MIEIKRYKILVKSKLSHKCEMGSLGNRVNNYIISLYGHR